MTAIFIALGVVITDQLTKFIVLKNLQVGESLPIIKNVFHINLVCNKGAAFGLFSQAKTPAFIWVFYISVIIIVLIFLLYKNFFRERNSTKIFLSMILGGAIGNLIDRIRMGFVIDFLDFRIWPVFNIADSAITIGTVLLILQMFKHKKVVGRR